MAQQYIFGDKYFKQWLDSFKLEEVSELESKIKIISNYIKAIESGCVEKTKEESIQADFLNNFFGEVLGYEYKAADKWNLEKEYKSQTDATKSDGALGFFSTNGNEIKADVRAVIELKDALTDLDKPQLRLNDKRTPAEQAFSYSSKAGGKCKWVIVSNFIEIRLYHSSDQGAYEKFIVTELLQPDKLKRFFYILRKENLITEEKESVIEKLFRERQELEQSISKKFYGEYKSLRMELFSHLKANNSGIDELLLFNKTQKLLDRFIFVCFCEDIGLLTPYTLQKIKDTNKIFFDFEPNKMWRQLKGLFHSIDAGNPPLEINKFNGGLFAKDELIDNFIIKDEMLLKFVTLSEYDFESDLNVNILGHIFEQSLSDIEEIKTQIGNGKALSQDEKSEVKKNGKRKKEGIFYTPEYITRYIVKEAVGGWLEDRRKELGFYELPELREEDYNSIKHEKKKSKQTGKIVETLTCNDNVHTHIVYWESYREKLRNIHVLDPACGSGAFLNQVFDFLYKEGQEVNAQLRVLQLGQYEMFDLDKHILTNNIFGVDLNSESVEITKLSLWLKTANKSKELTTLDQNIKCGNSLIDDIEIAGEKAFNWFAEFPQVFPNYRDKEKADRDKKRARIISTGVLDYPDLGDEEYADETDEPLFSYKPGSKGFEKYGFDVIIGNPPYVFAREKISEIDKNYFAQNYSTAQYQVNTYILFIERALKLLKVQGYFGFIVPNAWLMVSSAKNLRELLLEKTTIKEIVNLSGYSFEEVNVETIIINAKKEKTTSNEINIKLSEDHEFVFSHSKVQDEFLKNNGFEFKVFSDFTSDKLYDKIIQNTIKLNEISSIKAGLKAYEAGKGVPVQTPLDVKSRPYDFKNKVDDETYPYLEGKDVNRYYVDWSGSYLKYGDHLAAPRTFDIFSGTKIIIREITGLFPKSLNATYCEDVMLFNMSNIAINEKLNSQVSLKYILGILNSKLISYYFLKNTPKAVRKMFPKLTLEDLRKFPIKIPVSQKPLIDYVNIMLSKNKELFEIKTQFIKVLQSKFPEIKLTAKIDNWYNLSFADFSKELVKQKIKLSLNEQTEWLTHFEEHKAKVEAIKGIIENTDIAINKMVYELYELSPDEIAIIEEQK